MDSIIPFSENVYIYTLRQRYEELYIKVLTTCISEQYDYGFQCYSSLRVFIFYNLSMMSNLLLLQ